jgi:2,4-dienoyl-CoA reductase-like NADH-dependent reductase (Old Yellow Enzyme family)
MTIEELKQKADEYKLSLPYSENLDILATKHKIKDTSIILRNALAIHPMEGFDGTADGAPDELTERRYMRFAESGAGLIWFEATAVQEDGRTSPRQLWLNEGNVSKYARLIEKIHERSGGVPVILQLTHSGRFSKPNGKPAPVITYHNPIMNRSFNIPADYPVVTDDYLDRLEERFLSTAKLAYKAGFDGVDVKACHRYLLGEILSAYTRSGRHGGSYENRTRLFRSIVRNIRNEFGSSLAVGSRFGIFDAIDYPYGFGVDKNDYMQLDLEEPLRLTGELYSDGMRIINITMGTPYHNPHINRPYNSGGYLPPEHPIAGVNRLVKYAGIFQKSYPDITFIGTGYSYLGSAALNVAAGAVENSLISAVGFGRMAIAYNTFARDILNGKFDSKKVCLTCGKCTEIMRSGGTTGCPIRDSEVYLPIYKKYCSEKSGV